MDSTLNSISRYFCLSHAGTRAQLPRPSLLRGAACPAANPLVKHQQSLRPSQENFPHFSAKATVNHLIGLSQIKCKI